MGDHSDTDTDLDFMANPVSTKPRPSSSSSNSTSTSSNKHPRASTSTSDTSTSHFSHSHSKHKLKKKPSTEIILLSSDSEPDSTNPVRRPTPPPPPAVDLDKIEKAMDEIKRRLPGCDVRRAFLLFKRSGQNLDSTLQILGSEMRDKVKGGKGKEKEKEKGKEQEKRKEKVTLEKKKREIEVDELDQEGEGVGDEEEDQLASDPEDDGKDEESYWLDVEARSEALDEDAELAKAYRKAAWFQLCFDFSTTNESQIRNTFKLDSCGQLYAPTWLALHKIKKTLGHIKLTGKERNMDKKKTKDGNWVDRVAPEIPRKLELEMNWLEKYIKGGYGKGKGKGKDKGKGKATVKAPPRKQDQNVQSKKAAPQGKKKNLSPKKKKSKRSHDYGDSFDCEDEMALEIEQSERGGGGWGGNGWGEEALNRAYKSPKKHRSPGGSQPRFSAWKGGEQMNGGSGSQRRYREGTVPFSGKGRSLT